MSLSSAMSAALSGLTASARMAEVISANIANAATPGYVRRDTQLGTRAESAGVSVLGISRLQDRALLTDRRAAMAGQAGADGTLAFLETAETALGRAGEAGGLAQRIADLDAALLTAAAQPEAEPLLAAAVQAASDLAGQIAGAAATIAEARTAADGRIATQVTRLNTALARVEDLNSRILAQEAAGGDSSALQDQRQQQIDAIADILPLRELDRGDGRIALYTTGGAALVDGRAAVFGFDAAQAVTPDMAPGAGLSGLTLNGQPVDPAGRLIAGGSLAADFAIRDSLAPGLQQDLDAFAADLVARFSASDADPTLAAGADGLFTAGAATPPGLAQALRINPLVDPGQGGMVTRLRDGLGADTTGPVGEAGQILRLQATLNGAEPVADYGSSLLSAVATQRLSAEDDESFAAARLAGLAAAEAETGVDSDRELQQLLLVEQAFSANARVLQVADGMIGTLLEI